MPVAPNPLLQANALGSASRSAGAQLDKPLQAPGDKGDGFGQVMARQGRDKAASQDDKVAQAKPKDKPEAPAHGKKDPADKTAVADDGNKLPASDQASDPADTGLRDASLVAGQVTDAQPGAQLIQAQAEAVARHGRWIRGEIDGPKPPPDRATIRAELAGLNLACWCREGTPCHVDTLLKLANE